MAERYSQPATPKGRNRWPSTGRQGVAGYQIDNHIYYKTYFIQQGSKKRQIEEPSKHLKRLQKKLLPILEQFPLHPACMCRKGGSIGLNAAIHQDAKYLLKIDIKGCYQAINPGHLWYSLIVYKSDLVIQLWESLEKCFCLRDQGLSFLPTGAPTSPILCNIALTPIDYEIQAIADKYEMRYTRYLDDIILSTTGRRYWEILDLIREILDKYGFLLNKKKSKWSTRDCDKLVVTGVRLAERKVSRKLFKALKKEIIANGWNETMRGYLAFIKSIDQVVYNRLKILNRKEVNDRPQPTEDL